MERKSLRDISWQVDEPTYRADPALSYSTLARYEREGFNNLDKLFDRIETPSLVFGSCVDTLITGNEEEFNQLFMVAELDNSLSDTLVTIVKKLFNDFKDKYHALKDIPEETALIEEVIQFIESLKAEIVPELVQTNKADKAKVGTFFSVRDPKNAMRSFGAFIAKIDWAKSESLKDLFLPFKSLGEEKECNIQA